MTLIFESLLNKGNVRIIGGKPYKAVLAYRAQGGFYILSGMSENLSNIHRVSNGPRVRDFNHSLPSQYKMLRSILLNFMKSTSFAALIIGVHVSVECH
jgi:hypothetical protein